MNQQKTGGFSGVFKQGKKFRAMISVDGEQKHIGLWAKRRCHGARRIANANQLPYTQS